MNRCTTLMAAAALAATTAANAQLIFGGGLGGFFSTTTQNVTRYNNCFVALPPASTQADISQVDLYYFIPANAPAMNIELFATEMVWSGTGIEFTLGTETSLGVFALPAGTDAGATFIISLPTSVTLDLELASNPGFGGFWIGWRQDNLDATAPSSGVRTRIPPPAVGAAYNWFGSFDHTTQAFGLFVFGGGAANQSTFVVDVYGDLGGDGCDAPVATTAETETCGEDLNGGCNFDPSNPPQQSIDANSIVSGTYWADGGTRDTDWYVFTINETSEVKLDVYSDGPIIGSINSIDCPSVGLAAAGTACGATTTIACLPAGTYRVIVRTAVFNGFPCGLGSVNDYTFQLTSTPADCPEPCQSTEDCCFAHATPGCADEFCCDTICGLDPFCCIVAWDADCVAQVQTFCLNIDCPTICEASTNDCCLPSTTAGCSDTFCCDTVCGIDAFCCATAWDIFCAQQAYDFCGSCPAVANDDCEGASPISDGATGFTNLGATTSIADLPIECDKGFGLAFVRDLWYEYKATCTGTLTVSTCSAADFDTRLALYESCGGPAIACNDDGPDCTNFTSIMTAEVVCGQTYYIRVGAFDGADPIGSGTITVSCSGDCGSKCQSTGSADFNGNGCVNGNDLGTLLGLWGVGGGLSIADFNCDGKVDGNDLGVLLGQWGGTCAP